MSVILGRTLRAEELHSLNSETINVICLCEKVFLKVAETEKKSVNASKYTKPESYSSFLCFVYESFFACEIKTYLFCIFIVCGTNGSFSCQESSSLLLRSFRFKDHLKRKTSAQNLPRCIVSPKSKK